MMLEIKYGLLELKEGKYGNLEVIIHSESEWYGKHTGTTSIPNMTKEKYIDLHCKGVSDSEIGD